MDVAFLGSDGALAERLARVGLRLDLPEPRAQARWRPGAIRRGRLG